MNFQEQNVWEQLKKISPNSDLVFKKYEGEYDIKKFNLSALKLDEIKRKVQKYRERLSSFNPQNSKVWQENELRIYFWFVLMFAQHILVHPKLFEQNTWTFVASIFNKTVLNCKYYFKSTERGKSLPWTSEEDQIILQVLKKFNYEKKWSQIGFEIYKKTEGKCFRKPKVIRQRWMNYLNPQTKKTPWTPQEDAILLEAVLKIGKKWSRISSIIGSRQQNAVKNRFIHLQKYLGNSIKYGQKKQFQDEFTEYNNTEKQNWQPQNYEPQYQNDVKIQEQSQREGLSIIKEEEKQEVNRQIPDQEVKFEYPLNYPIFFIPQFPFGQYPPQ